MLSNHIISFVIQSYPIFLIQSYSVSSNTILFFVIVIQSYPLLSNPVLSFVIQPYPKLSNTILVIQPYPKLSNNIISFVIQSYRIVGVQMPYEKCLENLRRCTRKSSCLHKESKATDKQVRKKIVVR